MAFVSMSFLQISTVKCCTNGQVCPIGGTFSIVDKEDKDEVNTFFDCFNKNQGKTENYENDPFKKFKEVSTLFSDIPMPRYSSYSLISFNALLIYEGPFLNGPDLPG